MKRLAAALLLALLTAAPVVAAPLFPAKVKVEAGALQGAVEGDVVAWRSVPYAAAPVGDLRWRPPQPAVRWQGVREAKAMSPDCVQGRMPIQGAAPSGPQAEDCLYLNVWRPAAARKGERLPVLVWIHGGAFVNGGSSSPETFGDQLAKRGLVVVTFNYRLGRLGFFGHPALTAEHPNEAKGNYGLMDQQAVLRWVRRNIAAFGGDPANVTVMGGSAGGISINLHLGSPGAADLFDRAIVQSGAGRDLLGRERRLSQDLPDTPSAEALGVALAERLGVGGDGAQALAALRAQPAERITGDLSMMSLVLAGPKALYAGPIVDGKLIAATPEAMFRAGRQRALPLIVGATTADLSLDSATSADQAFARFGPDAEAARQAYDPEDGLTLAALNRALGGDRNMVEPARFVARAMAAGGQPTYAYRFGYVVESGRAKAPWGADHSTEVAYVFDRLDAVYSQVGDADRAVARQLADYWANFARDGDPNGSGLPPWPRYEAESDRLLLVGPDGTVAGGPDPWKARLDVNERLAERRR